MTRKTVTELYTQAQADFADNAIGAITPAKLRQFCLDFLDTIRPSYAAINIPGPYNKASTPTYTAMVWTNNLTPAGGEYSVSMASGTIQRNTGPATTRFSFNADVVAPNNTIVTFTLFVEDVATPWSVSVASTGATDPMSVSLTGLNYNAETLIRAVVQVKTDTNVTVTVTNAVFVVENVPVNVE